MFMASERLLSMCPLLRAVTLLVSLLVLPPGSPWMRIFAQVKDPGAPVVLLWPEGAPAAVGTEEADKPVLEIYLPPTGNAAGTGVVVCPREVWTNPLSGWQVSDSRPWPGRAPSRVRLVLPGGAEPEPLDRAGGRADLVEPGTGRQGESFCDGVPSLKSHEQLEWHSHRGDPWQRSAWQLHLHGFGAGWG